MPFSTALFAFLSQTYVVHLLFQGHLCEQQVLVHMPIYVVVLDFGLCFVPCVPNIPEDVRTASTRTDPPFRFLEMLTGPMLSHQILVAQFSIL